MGAKRITQSTYMYSRPETCSRYSITTRFEALPMGVAIPPRPAPQATDMTTILPALLFAMSPSPTYFSIDMAIGEMVAATTRFGSMADNAVDSRNQNMTCARTDVPTRFKNAVAIRLFSPVDSQEAVIIIPDSTSIMESDAYWEIISDIGIIGNRALSAMGKSPITG